ncbi:unnamed protein product [Pseudo-nitzschia multistriata]|uniref:Uncharacterized protein n=1 Tax=Pseudo-nitzschia multistriata TaxID=183589 RepID=A0A448Z206_9STRA|nr:unnamed protein product [Pseudo-nitzschia multistriata]
MAPLASASPKKGDGANGANGNKKTRHSPSVASKKEFGEKISIHKPDFQSMEKSSIRRVTLAIAGDNESDAEHEHDNSRRKGQHFPPSMLIPVLPSHVPTPQTIGTNDEPWAKYKVEDAFHHIQTIFSRGGGNSEGNTSDGGNANGSNTISHDGPIKYAPSPITPPQSPVSRKATVTLDLTPTATTTTRWGADFWNSHKKKNTNSPTSTMTNSLDVSQSPSSDKHSKNSAGGNEGNTTTNDNSSNYKNHPNKESIPAENNKIFDQETDDNHFDWAKQDAFLREVMARKRGRRPPSCSNGNKQQPPARSEEGVVATNTALSQPSKRPHSPPGSNTVGTIGGSRAKKTAASTRTKADSSRPLPSSVLPFSNHKQPPTPLQLQWMHENALNLQGHCRKNSYGI